MTFNFYSPSHLNPHMHVNTSCLPAHMPMHIHKHASCFPAHIPVHTSCRPAPCAFNSWHNHHDACNHHHDADNTLVLNICTPSCLQPKIEAKKPPVDLSKLAITTNPVTGEILEAITKNSTGQNMKQCIDIIQSAKNDLEIGLDGKLIGECNNHSSCKTCINAINTSILDARPANIGTIADTSKLAYSADNPAHDRYDIM